MRKGCSASMICRYLHLPSFSLPKADKRLLWPISTLTIPKWSLAHIQLNIHIHESKKKLPGNGLHTSISVCNPYHEQIMSPRVRRQTRIQVHQAIPTLGQVELMRDLLKTSLYHGHCSSGAVLGFGFWESIASLLH